MRDPRVSNLARILVAYSTKVKEGEIVSIDGEKDALNAIIAGEEGTSVQSSPFFGPVSFQTIDQYAGGQKLPDWIVVQDMQFTKDNAAANLANSF